MMYIRNMKYTESDVTKHGRVPNVTVHFGFKSSIFICFYCVNYFKSKVSESSLQSYLPEHSNPVKLLLGTVHQLAERKEFLKMFLLVKNKDKLLVNTSSHEVFNFLWL